MRVGLDARLAGRGLGVATLISALADGLPRLGIEVVWFGDARFAPDRVTEVVAPPGPGFAGLDSPRGYQLAVRHQVDVMHFAANSGWWNPGPVPHVITIHDLMWGRWFMRGRGARQIVGHSYLRLAVPRAIRGARGVSVPSATTAAAVRAAYRVDAELIHNAVADQWRVAPAYDPADVYVVAFAGRDPRKGTDVVLRAWARVASLGVRLVLLAGAGIPRRLERSVGALAARGQIDVLPYLPAARVVEILRRALALLYPSCDEGFGLPVLEAMAAGVPVISGLAPVTLEIGGDAVMLLDAHDPVGAAAAHVERLLAQPGLRQSLAVGGRRRAAAFTWSAALDRYRGLYQRALAR